MSVEDDCRVCEGWTHLDDDDLCGGCATEIQREPWEIATRDGISFSSPTTRYEAEYRARALSVGSYGSPKYAARRIPASPPNPAVIPPAEAPRPELRDPSSKEISMSISQNIDELHIPDESFRAMLDVHDDWDDDEILDNSIRAIAGPMIVAELRRLADEFARHPDRSVSVALRARADELDAGPVVDEIA